MTTALAALPTNQSIERQVMTRDQIELLKRTIAKGATDDELSLFVATANRLGLDPFAKQIHAVKRWDSKEGREVMAIQVAIDGFRVAAMRTGDVDGQEGPFWCGLDGKWHEVWLHKGPPAAAKVLVYRKGISRPFVGVATYDSYVQTKKDGTPNSMWSRGPDFMLAKCCEALALRKAFPAELGGVQAPEEVGDVEPGDKTFAPIAAVTVASTTQVATAKPAEPPKPPLTDDDIIEMITSIGSFTSLPELRKYAAENIQSANLTPPQREQLEKAYRDQQADIRAAEIADREAGGQA